MKRSVRFLALAVIVISGCRPSWAANPLDTLREVRIERRTLLMLGGRMPPTADFCIWNGATCTLKSGTFGGAEGMSLDKTKTGLISQFHFYYGMMSADAVNAQIDDYTRVLGRPSRDSKVRTGDFEARELVWSDSFTTFELSYKSGRKRVEASATLSDNALAGPVH